MVRQRVSVMLLATAFLLPLLLAAPSPVNAGSNKRPKPSPHRCLDLAKKIGPSKVWWGRHVGKRDLQPMFNWGPKQEHINQIGCFKTRKSCENWLYWMRTDFPHSTYYNPCRRGL